MSKTLILCDCSRSQQVNSDKLSAASGLACSPVHSTLCTSQIEILTNAIRSEDAIICCSQETLLFDEIASDLGIAPPPTLDLRDRAGWTADTGDAIPKMSALIAEAALNVPAPKTKDVVSEGLCLIIGSSEIAIKAAQKLQDLLSVTVLVTDEIDPPMEFGRGFNVVRGRLHKAKGALGQFSVLIDAFQLLETAGRTWSWSSPRDGALSECDIILDLSGGTALFPAPEKREGYLKADPNSLQATADAILEASQLVGTFEKPLYLRHETILCAHSRASQTGCSRCLNVCPTGAIQPNGDHVAIDPMICAGCGACAALCPSGAISYDAPPTESQFRRIQTLAKAYLDAGGKAPRLLVVNGLGMEMVRLAARFSDGLPTDVIPIEIEALNSFGHAETLAALAAGFTHVSILMAPTVEREVQESELALAQAIAGAEKASLLDLDDPEALSASLFNGPRPEPIHTPVRPVGTRRQVTRQAALALNSGDAVLPLPEGAPYGAVLVDQDSCTLCLSCVSLCPSGALGDNPDLPQLRFQEDACLQCGLCARVCPEQAIQYEPRLNLQSEALSQVVLNEEEPFACVECGSLFGVKSTIEKITEKLAGQHAMFANPEAARMIQMCDNCRVQAQFHQENNPFGGQERPRVRTTDDYLSKRRDH